MNEKTILEDRYHRLIEAVERAGGLLMLRQHEIVAGGKVVIKADRSIVTAADLESERVILEALQVHVPVPHAVISEEGAPAAPRSGDFPLWFLDPLDGTANYARGSGDYAILLSEWARGSPVFSIVHYPATGELLWAHELQAGWNLEVTSAPAAVAVTQFCYLRSDQLRAAVLETIGGQCIQDDTESTRALLDLAKRTITGTIIRICSHGNWDLAASIHLVLAAGGCVIDEHGAPLIMDGGTLGCRFVIAAESGKTGRALVGALNEHFDERP